jgi:hypothetical protein
MYIALYSNYFSTNAGSGSAGVVPPVPPVKSIGSSPINVTPPKQDLATLYKSASPKFSKYFTFSKDGDLIITTSKPDDLFLNNLSVYLVKLVEQYKIESLFSSSDILALLIDKFKRRIESMKELDLINESCDLFASRIVNTKVIDDNAALEYSRKHGITIWAMDRHISPPEDLKDVVKYLGLNITFIDRSLSGHCHIPKTCAPDGFPWKGRYYSDCTCRLRERREYFEKFKNYPEMQTVDVVYLTFEIASLEYYLPLNKYFILAPATRYHFGRYEVAGWNHLNWNIELLAKDPKNFFSGNNDYDSEFMRYYTGVKTETLTALCAYPKVERVAAPTRKEILVGPSHLRIPKEEWSKIMTVKGGLKYPVGALRDLYPHFQYSDITQHPAVIVIPYQISTMSIFEYYRMNMPMFFPSKSLLTQWHKSFNLVREISWFTTWNDHNTLKASPIPRHSCASDLKYDPTKLNPDGEDFQHWLDYADFYRFPHLIIFDSWEDLGKKINTVDLNAISAKMKAENVKIKAKLMGQYVSIFNKMFKGQKERKKIVSQDFNESMMKLWGVDMTKAKNECDDPIQPSLFCEKK